MKAKTRSGAKKRIRKTGSGQLKMMKAGRNHLLLQKSKKQKGKGGTGGIIIAPPAMLKQLRKALPNG